jgi:hypothetical protein
VSFPGGVWTSSATNVDASSALGTPAGSGTAGANGTFTVWTIPIVVSPFSTTLVSTQHPTGGATLADGIYQSTVHAPLVSDAFGTPMAADATGLKFHRLFGDVNGDQRVNAADYGFFTAAFGSNSTQGNYNPYFDSNDDNRINALDYGQLVLRFGKSLPHSG